MIALALAGASGCRKPPETDAARPARSERPAPDPWILSAWGPDEPTPALLTNGLIGLRLGRDGTGRGWPFFTIDDFETTGEEKIIPLHNPAGLDWSFEGQPIFDPQRVDRYRQTLDMRTGFLETSWVDPSGLSVEVVSVVHPSRRAFGQRWQFTSRREGTLRLTEAEPDPRLVRRLRVLRRPEAREWRLAPGRTFRFERTVDLEGPPPSFAALSEAAADHWREAWRTDIEIDGPVEDQQAIRSFLFYLRASVPAGLKPRSEQGGVGPFGLSDARYNGHVFWDADVWIMPALLFVDPERARSIVEYRLARLGGARENYRRWLRDGRPTGTGRVDSSVPTAQNALMFPWESSVSGLETIPGPSRFQHHISGTVVLGLEKALFQGLLSPEQLAEVGRGVAAFYRSRIEPGPGGAYALRGTMSPDEFFVGDNDLYTNLLVEGILARYGDPVRLVRPRDEVGFLTYEGDRLRGYKQAAALLAVYPLQHPEAEREARTMMARFAGRATPNGPAMSDSIEAVIWARLGEPEKAYEAWRRSWQRYTERSLMLFSERPRGRETNFLTGQGGCLQAVIFGFLGFRLGEGREEGALWEKIGGGGRTLSISPTLPPTWRSATFRNFTAFGERYTLSVSGNRVQVDPGDP